MRLYKITGERGSSGEAVQQYVGTQSDAGKLRKELKAEGVLYIETEEIDVPTDKQGLLAYLNSEPVPQN